MRRYSNLYQDIYNINNIMNCFQEVCRNTKNKDKVNKFKEYKCIYISRIYHELKNKTYEVGKFHMFYIYEPKKRRIVSLNMYDKVINHLVSRYILNPSLSPCLIDSNCASREGKGTSYALELYFKYRHIMDKKYKNYYLLKCDIKSYFSSINRDILKVKISKRIKETDSLNIINKIIESDEYLSIGFMSSQILGIFYLNDLDHYIKEELKIKYYVRYQDDFILIDKNKDYLKECLNKIRDFIKKEVELCYNKEVRDKLQLFLCKSYEEMKKIVGNNEELKIIMDEIERLNQEKYFGGLYDAEEEHRKMENTARLYGIEEGRNIGLLDK